MTEPTSAPITATGAPPGGGPPPGGYETEVTLVAGSDLEPGTSALFSAKVYEVADLPQTYNVAAVGYGE